MSIRYLRALAASLLSLFLFIAAQAAFAKAGVTEINGVVQTMPASGLIGAWTIAGRAVSTDSATVIKQQLGAIGVGALVEVKGSEDVGGNVLATSIEVKQGVGTPPPPGTGMSGEFTGAIQAMPGGSLLGQWTIAARTVQVVSTTILDQELGGFAVGATVEVHGTADAGGIVTASRIEVKTGGTPNPLPGGSSLEVMGQIEALPASGLLGTWRVGGRNIIVAAATVLDNEHGTFELGATVEVHGSPDKSGALAATRIERVAGNGAGEPALKFWGNIESLPSTPGFVGVWKIGGRIVNVGSSTALRVNDGPIVVGAIVEVDGWKQADGAIEAHEIETRTSMGSLAGQGPLAVEYVNAALGHYFLTAFTDDISILDSGAFGGSWKRTGESFRTGGAAAVCRFYGLPPKGPDSHFFTVDPRECEIVMRQWQAWTFESHAFATTPATAGTCPAGLVAVSRFYNNPSVGADMNHRYVTSAAAAAEMRGKGWIEEGVVMCAQR